MPRKKISLARKRPKTKVTVPTQVVQAEIHAPSPANKEPDPHTDVGNAEAEAAADGTTPAVATEAPTGIAEVSPTAHEEGETPLVRPSTPPLCIARDKEEQVLVGKSLGCGQGIGKEKAVSKAPKKDWSLSAAVEEDILEWLKGNSYLWLRSKKGYKQKRAAWEMKAQELGIDVDHLEQWWKGIKDWFVKLSKKTSGQATKMLTERETWVLRHCGFYKGSIPSDTGDPLVPLARVPSATVSRTPHSVDSDGDSQAHVLEDMESAAINQAPSTPPMVSRSRKRDKRRRDEEEEDTWMRDLRATMQANQALLEKLVEERPVSNREPFVRFVADTLRTAPQEQYDEMKELIFDIVRQGRRCQPGDCDQPSKSRARPTQDVSTTPANHQFSQPYSYQQHNPHYQQNWQYGNSFMQQTSFPPMQQTTSTSSSTHTQFNDQQPNYPQQQQPLPSRAAQQIESGQSWNRLLTQDTMQGDEWNANLSFDSTMLPSSGRSSLASQASMDTHNVLATPPGLQTKPQGQQNKEL